MNAFFIRSLVYVLMHKANRLKLMRHGVTFGKGVVVNGSIYIHNQGRIEIGNNVTINSGERFNPVGGHTRTRLIVYPGAVLRILDGAGISNSTIVARSLVEIGASAMIGGSCNIWDTDFHSLDPEIRGQQEDYGKCSPVIIGEQAFIGAHSIILKGSRIGARSIIGAGSVGSIKIQSDQRYLK